MMTLSGCEMLGDIFKAGAWIGAIGVIIIVAIIYFIVRAFKR
ncbi:MAG: hypothetical protein WD267_06745 [Balneolales bacterium]